MFSRVVLRPTDEKMNTTPPFEHLSMVPYVHPSPVAIGSPYEDDDEEDGYDDVEDWQLETIEEEYAKGNLRSLASPITKSEVSGGPTDGSEKGSS